VGKTAGVSDRAILVRLAVDATALRGYAPAMTDDARGPAPDDPRQELKDDLWGMGVTDDLAEGWIARWTAAAAELGVTGDDPRYWRLAAAWIDERRPAD